MPGRKAPHRLTASVTELLGFQSCKRRWYLGRMYSGRSSTPALYFGNGIHQGLEGYFKWKKLQPRDIPGQRQACHEAFDVWATEQVEVLKEEYGMLWEFAVTPFNQMVNLGEQILDNYIDYDQYAEISLRPILVEKRMFIPIDEDYDSTKINGNGKGLGARNVLTMRWDLLAETNNGLIGPADHKTSSGFHATGSALDIDEQMTGYAYGYWRLYKRQRTADVVIYDVLAKKIPAEPKVLKSGKLSKNKAQDTTHEKMMQAIKARNEDPADFAEVLYVLETKGMGNYFTREISPRNLLQVQNYEYRTRLIFEEMRRVIENPEMAYPSPSAFKCPSCPFLQVCIAMEDGGDAQYLLDSAFQRHGKTAWTLPPRFREKTG